MKYITEFTLCLYLWVIVGVAWLLAPFKIIDIIIPIFLTIFASGITMVAIVYIYTRKG
jgi:hypothetical protein